MLIAVGKRPRRPTRMPVGDIGALRVPVDRAALSGDAPSSDGAEPSAPAGRVPCVSTHPSMSRPSWATVAIVVAALIVALCALLFVGESRYRSCIARAEAEFPAVPVSSFTGEATGPLKVSFVNERAAALDECGRFF